MEVVREFLGHEDTPAEVAFRALGGSGAEVIGSESPMADAELIILLDGLLGDLGIADLELKLSSLGSSESRKVYRDELREYLRTEGSIYEQIRETGDLPDDLAEKLNKEVEKFKQMFNVEEESALV